MLHLYSANFKEYFVYALYGIQGYWLSWDRDEFNYLRIVSVEKY